jgi:hypothetical protein
VDDAPPQHPAHGNGDHGFGNIEPLSIVADETTPSCHPPESSLDDLSARQDFGALGGVTAPNHLDDEVLERGLIHQSKAAIGAIGEEMLSPRPSLAVLIQITCAPVLSEMSAVVRLIMIGRPSVSTAMCRLRPTIFLAASDVAHVCRK